MHREPSAQRRDVADCEPWVGVELRHFAALVAVAHERSLAGGAARLGCAPAAVGRQIAQLERTVGARLVGSAPEPDAAALTEVGVALAAHAERVLAQFEAARRDICALDAPDVS